MRVAKIFLWHVKSFSDVSFMWRYLWQNFVYFVAAIAYVAAIAASGRSPPKVPHTERGSCFASCWRILRVSGQTKSEMKHNHYSIYCVTYIHRLYMYYLHTGPGVSWSSQFEVGNAALPPQTGEFVTCLVSEFLVWSH